MLNQMTVRAPEELQEELKIRAGKQGLTRIKTEAKFKYE